MKGKVPRIAVIGSNMVDLITNITRMPNLGETLEATNFDLGCGGKGANQAVAAAKLGSEVLMISKVGDDIFGDNTIQNFKENNIDTKYVLKVKDTTSGVAPIFVDEKARNSILIVKGANNNLKPEDVETASVDINRCDIIIIQLEIPLETVYYAIEFGNKNNIPVILNPAPATKLDYNYVTKTSILVPNETELELITGMPVKNLAEIEKAAKSIIDKGVKIVIVTLGKNGSMLVTSEKVEIVKANSVVSKDTTGAGDAYIGSLAYYFVKTGDIIESMELASEYAGYSTLHTGTQKSYYSKYEFGKVCSKAFNK